ncbi:MAG: hypothetical protein ACTSX4_02870 [Candidatus Helarchaeota archaeon]
MEFDHKTIQVLERFGYKQVFVSNIHKIVFYKIDEHFNHATLTFIAVDSYKEFDEPTILIQTIKDLNKLVQKKPNSLLRTLGCQNLRIEKRNVFKGFNRFNFFSSKELKFYFYNDLPLFFIFLPVVFHKDLNEIQSRLIKNDPPIRLDHVNEELFEEYLIKIHHYRDQQLENVMIENEKQIFKINEKILSSVMGFTIGISIISLIMAFIRTIPLLMFPMTLIYVLIAFGVYQLLSILQYRKLSFQEQVRLKCPILLGMPFKTYKDAFIEPPEEEIDKILSEEANTEEMETNDGISQGMRKYLISSDDISNDNLKIEEKTLYNDQTSNINTIKINVLRKKILSLKEKWKNVSIDSPEFKKAMLELLLYASCYRYALLKGQITKGIRSILTLKEHVVEKISKIQGLFATLRQKDRIFEEKIPIINAIVKRLQDNLRKNEVSIIYQTITEVLKELLRNNSINNETMLEQDKSMEKEKELTHLVASKTPKETPPPNTSQAVQATPILTITHERNFSESLLSLNKPKMESINNSLKILSLDQFISYQKHPFSLLLLFDDDTKNSVNELQELLARMQLPKCEDFSINISNPEWEDVKRPVIIFRDDTRNVFVIDDFDPATLQDLIDDAPKRDRPLRFSSFKELKFEIINQIGRRVRPKAELSTKKEENVKSIDNFINEKEENPNKLEKHDENIIPSQVKDTKTFDDNLKHVELRKKLKEIQDETSKIKKTENEPENKIENEPVSTEFWEDNFHERIKAIQMLNGTGVLSKNQFDKSNEDEEIILGQENGQINLNYQKITTKKEFLSALKDKTLTVYIFHDEHVNPKSLLPPFEVNFNIRSIALVDCVRDTELKDTLFRLWVIRELDFRKISYVRREGKIRKSITRSQYVNMIKRRKIKLSKPMNINSHQKVEENELKFNSLRLLKQDNKFTSPPFLGVVIAKFDDIEGPIVIFRKDILNGNINLSEVVKNILSDENIQHEQVSSRTYDGCQIYFLIRKEIDRKYNRGILKEAYMIFLNPNAVLPSLQEVETCLKNLKLFEEKPLNEKGMAFHEQVATFIANY